MITEVSDLVIQDQPRKIQNNSFQNLYSDVIIVGESFEETKPIYHYIRMTCTVVINVFIVIFFVK